MVHLVLELDFLQKIPCYNPKQLVKVIKKKIQDSELKMDYVEDIVPYYKGFKGVIEYTENGKYFTRGLYSIKNNVVTITELPIGVWNEDYITFLEKTLENKKTKLKDYKDLSTDKDIYIELILMMNFMIVIALTRLRKILK